MNSNGSNKNVLAALMELDEINAHLIGVYRRQAELVKIVTAGVAISTFDADVVKQLSAVRAAIDS